MQFIADDRGFCIKCGSSAEHLDVELETILCKTCGIALTIEKHKRIRKGGKVTAIHTRESRQAIVAHTAVCNRALLVNSGIVVC